MNKKLIFQGLGLALGEAAYVALIASFFRFIGQFAGPDKNILGGVVILMLFVFSAAISGTLILGRPVLLYLDNKKKEAIELFGITLGWIFVFLITLLFIIIL